MYDWSARSEAQLRRWERERARQKRIAPYLEEFQKQQEQRIREERRERVRFWANLERRSPLAAERLPVAHRCILRPLRERDFQALVAGIETPPMRKAMLDFQMLAAAMFFHTLAPFQDPGLLAQITGLPRSSRRRRKPMPERLLPSDGERLRSLKRQDWILLLNGQITPQMADAIFELGV